MPPGLFVVIKGQVRLMTSLSSGRTVTIDRRGPGQMLGWISILRGESCELVQASEPTVALLIPAKLLVELWSSNTEFYDYFQRLTSPSETAFVLGKLYQQFVAPPSDEESWLKNALSVTSFLDSSRPIDALSSDLIILLSTSLQEGSRNPSPVGARLKRDSFLEYACDWLTPFNSNVRLLASPSYCIDPYMREDLDVDNSSSHSTATSLTLEQQAKKSEEVLSRIASAEDLGLLPAEKLPSSEKYKAYKGSGIIDQTFSVLRALSERLTVPFPKEIIYRILRQQLNKRSELSLELLAILCESLDLQSRIGKVRVDQIPSLEWPALFIQKKSSGNVPILIHAYENGDLIVADPRVGLTKLLPSELLDQDSKLLRVLLVTRKETSRVNRFGWSWFTPLLKKFKWSLLLVLVATFATQLATLAIPLLMQQIIDKTLSQGNISSLNVLGAALITIALFQSLMTGLRTFIFKDTADRMDLQLGATVIDRLLSLPLQYFDKRPVGELSQRLSEMNSIRGFLTGTAITSVMDLIFSAIYLVVMVLYSPLLTIVALSTFPIYVILVFVVSPLYKSLIRRQAVAQAKTQSHVIEVLNAIQTVKAQNVELASRWKWQDRYQGVVEEGFKAVTVGTVSGQIGNFLNTLSSLLILWIGMIQVIEGNLSLGQLIAFRIIAGYVTGPLLRLSNLYQGFQKVSLSFERLGDIINQQPETIVNSGQIALPPIEGEVRYESLNFRFDSRTPYILSNVSLRIEPGEFVGVVGLSGSGKSTLMKLLGRLYNPESGRIVVDGYDISKVDLGSLRQQIGIVPQESLLFEGTVMDNLSLGRPEADSDTIITAAKQACAHDFIMELKDGYNTVLSERGSNLSGGQRQRLTIARTLLNEPRLLVMDEATSALDYQTESQVCANLRETLRGKTVFFITHRLGTIRNADKIVFMHQGQIKEVGTHEELMNLKGAYFALYRQQESTLAN